MNVLSLFDGISCGRIALERAGIKVDKYYASEVDKYAIQVSKKNWPDILHIWSVKDISYGGWVLIANDLSLLAHIYDWWSWEKVDIDMIIWWSPCQDLSIAKKDWKWLKGEKSWLFFEYVRLLEEVKPKYFLLENVASMKKEDREEITRIISEIYPDSQCYLINSALVSAQNRKRLYWTNIPGVTIPEDKWIYLKDIIEDQVDEKYEVQWVAMRNRGEWKMPEYNNIGKANAMTTVRTDSMISIRVWQFNSWGQGDRVYSIEWKSVSLSANGGWRGAKTGLYEVSPIIRKLTPVECERLQTIPDNYTEWISNTQRYKTIWNGWTVDVIAHIFSFIQ